MPRPQARPAASAFADLDAAASAAGIGDPFEELDRLAGITELPETLTREHLLKEQALTPEQKRRAGATAQALEAGGASPAAARLRAIERTLVHQRPLSAEGAETVVPAPPPGTTGPALRADAPPTRVPDPTAPLGYRYVYGAEEEAPFEYLAGAPPPRYAAPPETLGERIARGVLTVPSRLAIGAVGLPVAAIEHPRETAEAFVPFAPAARAGMEATERGEEFWPAFAGAVQAGPEQPLLSAFGARGAARGVQRIARFPDELAEAGGEAVGQINREVGVQPPVPPPVEAPPAPAPAAPTGEAGTAKAVADVKAARAAQKAAKKATAAGELLADGQPPPGGVTPAMVLKLREQGKTDAWIRENLEVAPEEAVSPPPEATAATPEGGAAGGLTPPPGETPSPAPARGPAAPGMPTPAPERPVAAPGAAPAGPVADPIVRARAVGSYWADKAGDYAETSQGIEAREGRPGGTFKEINERQAKKKMERAAVLAHRATQGQATPAELAEIEKMWKRLPKDRRNVPAPDPGKSIVENAEERAVSDPGQASEIPPPGTPTELHGGFPLVPALRAVVDRFVKPAVAKARKIVRSVTDEKAEHLRVGGLPKLAEEFTKADPERARAYANEVGRVISEMSGEKRLTPEQRELYNRTLDRWSDSPPTDAERALWMAKPEFARLADALQKYREWAEPEKMVADPGIEFIPDWYPRRVGVREAGAEAARPGPTPRVSGGARVERPGFQFRRRRKAGWAYPSLEVQITADAKQVTLRARRNAFIREALETGRRLEPGESPREGFRAHRLTEQQVTVAKELHIVPEDTPADRVVSWEVPEPVEYVLRDWNPSLTPTEIEMGGLLKLAGDLSRLQASADWPGLGYVISTFWRTPFAQDSPQVAWQMARAVVRAYAANGLERFLPQKIVERARMSPAEYGLLLKARKAGVEVGGGQVPEDLAAQSRVVRAYTKFADRVMFDSGGYRDQVVAAVTDLRTRAPTFFDRITGVGKLDLENPAEAEALGREIHGLVGQTALHGWNPTAKKAARGAFAYTSFRLPGYRLAYDAMTKRPISTLFKIGLSVELVNLLSTSASEKEPHFTWDNDPENWLAIEFPQKNEQGQHLAIGLGGLLGQMLRVTGISDLVRTQLSRPEGVDWRDVERIAAETPQRVAREIGFALHSIWRAGVPLVTGGESLQGGRVFSTETPERIPWDYAKYLAGEAVWPLRPLTQATPGEGGRLRAIQVVLELVGIPSPQAYGRTPSAEMARRRADLDQWIKRLVTEGGMSLETANKRLVEAGGLPLSVDELETIFKHRMSGRRVMEVERAMRRIEGVQDLPRHGVESLAPKRLVPRTVRGAWRDFWQEGAR